MKIPEKLFILINPIMRFILRSPIHWLFSNSLMLITFRGLKSGRVFTTPVRYIRYEKSILCFSSTENNWWRNLLGGAEVKLNIKGREDRYLATSITEPEETRKWLLYYLELFPEDAVYHNIRLEQNKRLNQQDLALSIKQAVLVRANLNKDLAAEIGCE